MDRHGRGAQACEDDERMEYDACMEYSNETACALELSGNSSGLAWGLLTLFSTDVPLLARILRANGLGGLSAWVSQGVLDTWEAFQVVPLLLAGFAVVVSLHYAGLFTGRYIGVVRGICRNCQVHTIQERWFDHLMISHFLFVPHIFCLFSASLGILAGLCARRAAR